MSSGGRPSTPSGGSAEPLTAKSQLIQYLTNKLEGLNKHDPYSHKQAFEEFLGKVEEDNVEYTSKAMSKALLEHGVSDKTLRTIYLQGIFESLGPFVLVEAKPYFLIPTGDNYSDDAIRQVQGELRNDDATAEILKVAKVNSRPLSGDELFTCFEKLMKHRDGVTPVPCSGSAPSPMYKTSTHISVLSQLAVMVHSHLAGMFDDSEGEHSRVLVGPKGIGKTTTFQIFTELAPFVYGNQVLPIYVSYKGNHWWLRLKSIGETLSALLEAAGVSHARCGMGSIEKRCANALHNQNKYCLLLIDELDELYTMPSDNDAVPTLMESLNELGALSQHGFGKSIAVCVTGSSHALPLLINKDALTQPILKARFPLVLESPDLNSTKYESWIIDVASTTDYRVVSRILEYDMNDEDTARLCYLVTFFQGTNTRALRKVPGRKPNLENCHDVLAKRPVELLIAATRNVFYGEVLEECYNRNKKLFQSLQYENGKLNLTEVKAETLDNFQPLKTQEIRMKCDNFSEEALTSFIDDGLGVSIQKGIFTWIMPSSMFLVWALHTVTIEKPIFSFENISGVIRSFVIPVASSGGTSLAAEAGSAIARSIVPT
eukprot:gb/GECG01016764.1/.p1 GENE.gb/GECG01016764.1/~~gb/GECG01016764.1/.p1  ORF type:complete len:601 (+),score=59.04 gb/GECG01016764.1/:1-1803(+)